MRAPCLAKLFASALALCSWPASAFLDLPYITPANPAIHELVSVNIYGGECDLVDMGVVLPLTTQKGSEITILFTGIHEGDPEWCYYHIGTSTFHLGTFPPGSYTLDVERRYGTPFGTWAQETLGVIPFTVAGAPTAPAEAPASSSASLAILLAALTGTALFALHQRPRWFR
jgi:hypothetical protein